jgi:ankyrin repeat protein
MDETHKLSVPKELLNKIKTKSNYKTLEEYYNNNKDSLDLNQQDEDKRTPLIHAIVNKNYEAVKFLLENNVDVSKTDSVIEI